MFISEKIKYYFFLRKLAKQKTELMWTALNDLEYFRRHCSKQLDPKHEAAQRKKMAEERAKSNPNEEVIETLNKEINEAQAIKRVYMQTLKLTEDLPAYIADLEAQKLNISRLFLINKDNTEGTNYVNHPNS